MAPGGIRPAHPCFRNDLQQQQRVLPHRVLNVAEKPSVAREITSQLGGGGVSRGSMWQCSFCVLLRGSVAFSSLAMQVATVMESRSPSSPTPYGKRIRASKLDSANQRQHGRDKGNNTFQHPRQCRMVVTAVRGHLLETQPHAR